MWNNYNQYSRMPFNPMSAYNPQTTPQSFQSSGPSISAPYQQPDSLRSQNNLIWVRGKENARSMQLQPNSTLIMLDNEANKFYIKTTDDIGLGRLRVFNYIEEDDNQSAEQQQKVDTLDLSNYVTKEELDNIISTLKGDKNEQSLSTVKPTKQSAKK